MKISNWKRLSSSVADVRHLPYRTQANDLALSLETWAVCLPPGHVAAKFATSLPAMVVRAEGCPPLTVPHLDVRPGTARR